MAGRSSSSTTTVSVMAPPSPHPTKYKVFLSFRGVDTRNNFTSHLYAGLCRMKIETFIDNRLERGDKISPELDKAIEESMIYVIIFSENYASSSWCLNELVNILKYKKKYDERHVIPVFYKVQPSIVRYQEGSYADALLGQKEWFGDDEIQRWKDALTEAAGIHEEEIRPTDAAGIHEEALVDDKVVRSWKVALNDAAGFSGTGVNGTRPESMIVDGIVEDILKKLSRSFSSTDDQGIIGIDKHIAEIQSKLRLESVDDVRIIGIWGMGGIGKTTLARALFHRLGTQFTSRSLIVNAQQEVDRVGTYGLRKTYLSELWGEDVSSNGLDYAIERVKQLKVLLILDDVKNSSQIQELIGERGSFFGPGSRIIVTSRDKQVLKNAHAEDDEIYEVKEMNYQDSLHLFSLHAFKQICPVEGYADLVDKVLQYAKGVPLALKVLGSLLFHQNREKWEDELGKLKELPNVDIFDVLKISYDGLDRFQKEIFLDIACFYAGHIVNRVVELLDSCGFRAKSEMAILEDRCLISISGDQVMVHDLILEMGKEIVCQQCVNDPRKRSRLWKNEDIYHVFRTKKGKAAIHCIFLDVCRMKKVKVHPKFFNSMHNLRMLYFYKHCSSQNVQSNVIISDVLESLPESLKVLRWDEFPKKSLPLDFDPEHLVELHMPHSHLEQLWEDDQVQKLPNLKRLDLSHSRNLIRIPDLSTSPNIEEIILSGCESLTSLQSELCNLKLLRRLDLNRCKNLEKFPEIKETMEKLVVLVLCETAIQELPSSLDHLVGLEELSLAFCSKLEIIPSSIDSLTKLCKLDLTCCESLKTFPSSISKLVGLLILSLDRCRNLKSLTNNIGNLKLLSELDCSGCVTLTEIPYDIGRLSSLKKLSLQDTGIVNLPESIVYLSSLEVLDVSECKKLVCIPQLPPSLKQLLAFDCASITRVVPNPSGSKKGSFEFHFTNNEEPDVRGNVVDDAWLRINEDAYRFVYYCFPGSGVPHWFGHQCWGNSVTVDKDSLNQCKDNRLIGFAMCVVLQEDIKCELFRCRLTFESDGPTHILPDNDQLINSITSSGRQTGHVMRGHTFIWKYHLMESASIDKGIFHRLNFTFGISDPLLNFKSSLPVKECGICPLYTKEKDDIGDLVDSLKPLQVSNNDLEET